MLKSSGYEYKYPTLAGAVTEIVHSYTTLVKETKHPTVPDIPSDSEVDQMNLDRFQSWVLKKAFAHLRAKREGVAMYKKVPADSLETDKTVSKEKSKS